MSHFKQLPEFEREFLKLSKKYPSLPEDLKKFERLLGLNPVGFGSNFITIHYSEEIKIINNNIE
mgnify:CR=1 FL=1